MVADFDFRGLADILGTHIGFLKANSKVEVFTYAGEFVDEPLHCYLRVCFQCSIVIEENVTHKNSFEFGLGTEASHVEGVYRRYGYEGTHHQWKSQRHRTRGTRKRFQRVSGLRHSPFSRCSRREIV